AYAAGEGQVDVVLDLHLVRLNVTPEPVLQWTDRRRPLPPLSASVAEPEEPSVDHEFQLA
ncbi:hypothetical protein ACLBUT_26110, partial [Pseudomonas aeruginosa]|uniref:hypothetical protein n=1 Tax=Pseudomonas aeruginosa TaxID=287 RepID=UPI003967E117